MAVAPIEISRDEEIRLIWTQNQWLYIILGFIGGLLFFPLLQSIVSNASDILGGLVPEALGILFTVLLIDRLNRRRDEKNVIKQLQEQLIRDASSRVNDVASNAIHQLRKRDWLEGDKGVLVGENLIGANLREAVLSGANLQRAMLMGVNLQGSTLVGTNLYGADLIAADLRDTNFMYSNLRATDLQGANLQGANLLGACLKDANLWAGEELLITEFDETTILPDGKHWTSNTDMTKFTKTEDPWCEFFEYV